MTIDITQIIIAVIGLIFSAVTTWLVTALAPAVRNWLNAHANETQHKLLCDLIRQLVDAAEQMIVGKGQGAAKLQFVKEQLNKRGFDVDVEMIEAAVKEMNNNSICHILGEEVEE